MYSLRMAIIVVDQIAMYNVREVARNDEPTVIT